MSKYRPLWEYVKSAGSYPLKLTFDEIGAVLGFPIDHSFLTYKKEASEYGLSVKKISLKDKTVVFDRLQLLYG